MPSYGIVPAISSLKGAVGYFEQGLFGDRQQGHAGIQQGGAAAEEEERQSLLSQVRRGLMIGVLGGQVPPTHCTLGGLLMAQQLSMGTSRGVSSSAAVTED